MDRKAFLQRLQPRARERYGVEVTDRMVKDWIDERLLANPIPLGRRREWGCLHYRRALQICRLRAEGAERHTDLRFRLWMRGADIAFSRPRRAQFKDVRESIVEEFDRRRKQLLQGMPVDAGPPLKEGDDIRRPRPDTILRHVGAASPEILPPGFAYLPKELLAFYDASIFGAPTKVFDEAMSRAFDAFGLSALTQCFVGAGMTPQDTVGLASVMLGMGADPSLIPDTAIHTIEHADERTFLNARAIVRLLPWVFGNLGDIISAVSPDLRPLGQALNAPFARVAIAAVGEVNPWGLMIFVAVLCAIDGAPDKGRQMGAFARNVFPLLRRLIAKCSGNSVVSEMLGDENPLAFLVLLATKRADLSADMQVIRHRLMRHLWHDGLSDLHRARKPPHRAEEG